VSKQCFIHRESSDWETSTQFLVAKNNRIKGGENWRKTAKNSIRANAIVSAFISGAFVVLANSSAKVAKLANVVLIESQC
jgi:hypothetical protein